MMTSLPAAGDTWGIPGPTFLAIFVTAAAVVVFGSTAHRIGLRVRRCAPGDDRLSAVEAAYLNGGERLAVYTSLGGLRAARAIGVGPDKLLTTAGPMPADVTALDQAVYNAAGKRLRVRDLRSDTWVAGALDNLRRGLEGRRLLLGSLHRRTARLGSVLLLGLLAVGLLRLYAGITTGKPIGFLVISLVVLFVIVLMLIRVPRCSGAGSAALKQLRSRQGYLTPAQVPAYATYGPGSAAMGVALFGTASLWTLDPAFAAEAEIHRSSASTSVGGDSGGGCGGGSSCGGGCGGGGCGG